MQKPVCVKECPFPASAESEDEQFWMRSWQGGVSVAAAVVACLSLLHSSGWLVSPAKTTELAELSRQFVDTKDSIKELRDDIKRVVSLQLDHTRAIARLEGSRRVRGLPDDMKSVPPRAHDGSRFAWQSPYFPSAQTP